MIIMCRYKIIILALVFFCKKGYDRYKNKRGIYAKI